MNEIRYVLLCATCGVLCNSLALAQDADHAAAPMQRPDAAEIVRYQNEVSYAHAEPASLDGVPGLAVVFEGTEDLHYYARAETAPAPELQLKVEARSGGIEFGDAVFPAWEIFDDPTGQRIEVYVGDFPVFIPILKEETLAGQAEKAEVTIRIAGIACTSLLCLPPFEKTLTTPIDLSKLDTWPPISLTAASQTAGTTEAQARATAGPDAERQTVLSYSRGVYYLLALVAGLSINVMPCVLPVLPLVLMRLIGRSGQSGGKRIASGLAFCAGVILFFAAFALVSAIINLSTGAVLDLNSLFRYPTAVIVLFLAIVFFGLVMLDVATLSLPSSMAGGQGAASGMAGSVGMGFFAGVLSTPCSGALLGFVLVWAQTQPLLVSSTAIVLMGVGMALPYAVIVLVPSLLNRLPKPGHWMEVFKKSTGFLLFFIAVKLTLTALPKDRLVNVLTYGILFSFCVWIWGKWVGLGTPAVRRWTVRLIAVVLAVGAGFWLLPARGPSAEAAIDWHSYDPDLIQQTVAQKQPVLLKFTADWCTNCKVVDRRVYQDPDVVAMVRQKNVLAVKADTTVIDYPATRDLKQVYGEAGNVPTTILLLPDGSQEKLRGIFDKEKLIQILARAPGSDK